jgi:hypothetical protein
MASYDVAMWLRSEKLWPEIILVVHAETARDAVWLVLQARRVHHAVNVAAHVFSDAHIARWHGVTTLVDRFDYQHETFLLMGVPVVHAESDAT